MNEREKRILTVLAQLNFLIFCCAAPVLIYLLNIGGAQTQTQSLVAAIIPTRRPTLTPAPTVTPTRPLSTPTLEVGWKLFSKPGEGFAIALPPSWEELPFSDASAFKDSVAMLGKKNPKVATAIKYTPTDPMAKLYAVDISTGSVVDNMVANISVLHRTDFPEGPIDDMLPTLLDEFKGIKGVDSSTVTNRRVMLTVGNSETIRFRINYTRPDGIASSTTVTEYIITRGTHLYIIAFGHPPRVDSKYSPLEEKIANTFRWTGN